MWCFLLCLWEKTDNWDEKAKDACGHPGSRGEGWAWGLGKEQGQDDPALRDAFSAVSPGPPASGQGAAGDQGTF